ncbi:hypothetical protein LQ327_09365 [Actinomycetospora endophytica]|uniref:Uncharacterized protein n=1 Tax=Actinomycetospora endophytica TaxID=2291215 RepID=A0ABS8P5R2_9PSEU|nr:hypothetical protein [Actinomycetospora endophytica]MCD2193589.1 hypothetical protein [Actinomycetospora endophytica]
MSDDHTPHPDQETPPPAGAAGVPARPAEVRALNEREAEEAVPGLFPAPHRVRPVSGEDGAR